MTRHRWFFHLSRWGWGRGRVISRVLSCRCGHCGVTMLRFIRGRFLRVNFLISIRVVVIKGSFGRLFFVESSPHIPHYLLRPKRFFIPWGGFQQPRVRRYQRRWLWRRRCFSRRIYRFRFFCWLRNFSPVCFCFGFFCGFFFSCLQISSTF